MSKGGEGMKEGWKMVKLGEVCKIGMGKTPPRGENKYWDVEKTTGNIWVSIADMSKSTGGYIYDSKEYISIAGASLMSIIPKGTILLSFKLSLGKALIAGENLYTNEAIANLPLISKEIGKDYLLYYFQYFDWEKYASGNEKVKGKTLNKKTLEILPVIFPPLEEQHRIVSILDASFKKIDALKKNAEENLKNAKALFQQVLAQELKPKEGWRKYILENICTNIVDCPHSTPQKSDEITNYPCIRTSELRNGKIYWDSMQYLDKYEYEKRVVRLIPKAGDIVYGREGTFGDAVLLPEGYNFSLGQRTMLLRPDTTIVCSEFLLITMISPYVYKQAKDKNSGCGVGHVNVKDIKKFTIYLPDDISEQHRIVHTLDTLSDKCRRLEQVAQQTIRECDALKQSILRRAFSGEL